ncbi:hypothetical protein Tco_1146398 [Tanacetum coccineum]
MEGDDGGSAKSGCSLFPAGSNLSKIQKSFSNAGMHVSVFVHDFNQTTWRLNTILKKHGGAGVKKVGLLTIIFQLTTGNMKFAGHLGSAPDSSRAKVPDFHSLTQFFTQSMDNIFINLLTEQSLQHSMLPQNRFRTIFSQRDLSLGKSIPSEMSLGKS